MAKQKQPSGDYEVGFGRPPVQSRFKPGASGNPRGRPKGPRTAAQVFAAEGKKLVNVKSEAGIKRISKSTALVGTLVDQALRGSLPAAKLALPFLFPDVPQVAEDAIAATLTIAEREAILILQERLNLGRDEV